MGIDNGLELSGMVTAAQVRVMVGELSLSKISLDDFEEWLTRVSWNMHQNPNVDDETKKFVGAIELRLADSDSSKLIGELEKAAGFYSIGEKPSVVTAANVETIPLTCLFEPQAGADKQPEMVFG